MTLPTLPKSWSWRKLGEFITAIEAGKNFRCEERPPRAGEVGVVKVSAVTRDFFDESEAKTCPDPRRIDERLFIRPGDLLIGRASGSLRLVGRAALVGSVAGRLMLSDKVLRIKTSGIDPRWVMYILRSPQGRDEIERLATGIDMHNIGQDRIRQMVIPVAPAAEQGRIVGEIEKQFTRLDAGVAALERLQAHLRRYRGAVLKAACEGKLVPTEATLARANGTSFESGEALVSKILLSRRALHSASGSKRRYQEPEAPAGPSAALPEGWGAATVEQLAQAVEYGSSSKTREDTGVPVLRMGNIVDGTLNTSSLKYLPPNHDEFPDLLLQPGDVLFNRTNSPELVGKTAVYVGSPSPCSFASYLIRVRLIDGYSPHFLSTFINSVFGREWIKSVVVQQVGQANVNGSKLQALVVPVPPAAEQGRIVEELSRRLSEISATQNAVTRALARASRLRASVLRLAFEGRLVAPENPARAPAA